MSKVFLHPWSPVLQNPVGFQIKGQETPVLVFISESYDDTAGLRWRNVQIPCDCTLRNVVKLSDYLAMFMLLVEKDTVDSVAKYNMKADTELERSKFKQGE